MAKKKPVTGDMSESSSVPQTLGETARQKTSDVQQLTGGTNEKIRGVMQTEAQLREVDRNLQGILAEGMTYLDEARGLLSTEMGMKDKDIDARVGGVRLERDESLMTEDYRERAAFYREVQKLLSEKPQGKDGLSDNVWRRKVADFLATRAGNVGAYIMGKPEFQSRVIELIGKEYNKTEHDQLKSEVVQKMAQEGVVETLAKSRVRNFFDALRVLSVKGKTEEPLSSESLAGLLGHVQSDEAIRKAFEGTYDHIKGLPAGSVRLVTADKEVAFYHEADADIPASVIKELRLTDKHMPRKILFVHYRTDTDIRMLIRDMSDGERIVAKAVKKGKVTDQNIVIEGKSGHDECTIVENPAKVSMEELLGSPMMHMSHDFEFVVSGTDKPETPAS